MNRPRSSGSGILRPPNGQTKFNKLSARSRGAAKIEAQHAAEPGAADAVPAAVTGHRLVRFDRRRDPRWNLGPRGARSGTVHELAKAGGTAKPGRPCWRSDGGSTEVPTAGSWTPTGHGGGSSPPERDFLVGSVLPETRGRSESASSRNQPQHRDGSVRRRSEANPPEKNSPESRPKPVKTAS